MTVYLDIILFENVLMNYIILFATGFITKQKMRQLRLIISSVLGGMYAIVSYLRIVPVYSNFLVKILLSVIMIYIGFNPKNFKIMIRQLILFYLTSFVLGGMAFALLYLIDPTKVIFNDGVLVGDYPIKVTMIAGIAGVILIQIAFRIMKNRVSKKDMYCEIEVVLFEKSLRVKSYIDSGNMLKDPISKMPVVVIEREVLREIIPGSILYQLEKLETVEGSDAYEQIDSTYLSRIRMIPFTSIGKHHGMLVGLKTDYIKVKFDEEIENKENVIIGIYNKSLSPSKEYRALVGLDILERSEKNELVTNYKG